MIEDGAIIAKINQQKGMISFLEMIEEYDTATMASKLDSKVKEIIDLVKEVKAKDKDVVLSVPYVSLTMPQEEEGQGGGGFRDSDDRTLQRVLAESRFST